MALLSVAVPVVGALSACAATAADSHDERFLEGLRGRGLFELAESYCIDRLADSQLDPQRRATLVSELSRTYAAHAIQLPADARQPLWEKARQVVDEFVKTHPRDPHLPLVRMQGTLAALAEGELVRQEAEMAERPADERDKARDILRTAIGELHELKESVDVELRGRNRATRGGDNQRLSSDELASLNLHIQYQLARGLRNQGLCYPQATADRINSLGQAIDLLATLAQFDMTPSLAWQVRVDEIACLRLVGHFNEAQRKLLAAEQGDPPDWIMPRLREEHVRLPLARGRVDEALSEAGPPGSNRGGTSTELDLARLEAYLAGWRRAHDGRDSGATQHWEDAALAQVRTIRNHGNASATRRAESLLARSIVQSAGTDNPRALLMAAQSLFRGGRLDEARAAYQRVAKRAKAAGDKQSYFDSTHAIGAMDYEAQDYAAALSGLAPLAVAMPQHPRAAEAHLLAIHSAAQVAQQQDPPQLDEYEKLLRQHVELWSGSTTASQAWWWLGRLLQHQQSWQEAIRALAHIQASDPQYVEAVNAIGQCYESALAQMRQRGNRNELLARDAVDYLQRVIAHPGADSPEHTEAARAAILSAARIYMTEIRGGGTNAERLLNTALREHPAAPPKWKQRVRALLVPALAASGHVASANELLNQLPIGSTDEALRLTELLAAVKQQAAAGDQPALARLELTAISDTLAKSGNLDEATTKSLYGRRADILLETGQRGEALAALRKLAEKYPRDGNIQEQLASQLTAGGDEPSRRAALSKWREIAKHCRPGSARWLRAHLAQARLQLELGDPGNARATIKLVESSHPQMGGPEMKARFQQLLAECDRAPGG